MNYICIQLQLTIAHMHSLSKSSHITHSLTNFALFLPVFAYGATGAGKTYTMVGRPDCPGITLLTLMELYRRIDEREEQDPNTSIQVAVSYLEVYNETVRDLLKPGKPLQVSNK